MFDFLSLFNLFMLRDLVRGLYTFNRFFSKDGLYSLSVKTPQVFFGIKEDFIKWPYVLNIHFVFGNDKRSRNIDSIYVGLRNFGISF